MQYNSAVMLGENKIKKMKIILLLYSTKRYGSDFMNNEELESKILLIKNSIDVLQEHLAQDLITKELVLLRYYYSANEINKLNLYLYNLAVNNEVVTKKQFQEKLSEIREMPEIPLRQVEDVLKGYKNSDLYVELIESILAQ